MQGRGSDIQRNGALRWAQVQQRSHLTWALVRGLLCQLLKQKKRHRGEDLQPEKGVHPGLSCHHNDHANQFQASTPHRHGYAALDEQVQLQQLRQEGLPAALRLPAYKRRQEVRRTVGVDAMCNIS